MELDGTVQVVDRAAPNLKQHLLVVSHVVGGAVERRVHEQRAVKGVLKRFRIEKI